MATLGRVFPAVVDLKGTELILDADADTTITADTDDQIDIKIAGADDFQFTANTFTVLSGSTLAVASGATIANSGTATGFGAGTENAFAGVLQTNANFVDQVIFGPAVDGKSWNGLWDKSGVFSSLMLATIEDEGSNTEINIWDLTEQTSGAISTTPLATIDLSAAATPTSIAASMGYLIVGSEDGFAIIDPHSGAWAERTVGWPRTLSTSTVPALTDNDVIDVTAGFSDTPAYDPRTGGSAPTFAIQYGTGADSTSLIKDDGNVWDRSTAEVDIKGVAIFNGHLYYSLQSSNNNAYTPEQAISTIVADDWGQTNLTGVTSARQGLGTDNGFSIAGSTWAMAGALGLTQALINHGGYSSTTRRTAGAMINRTYNTGYLAGDLRGAWLANSKTVDRSDSANTLTENGTVTEAAVESSAELLGYNDFSDTTNYLSRAHDTDLDFGTDNFSMMIWAKRSGTTGNNFFISNGAGSGSHWGMMTGTSGTCRYFMTDAAGAGVDAYGATNVSDGVWHHLVATWDGGTETGALYVDGRLDGTTTAGSSTATMTNASATLSIGARYDGASAADQMTLSLCRISAIIPTATQIRQMYDAEKGMFVASAECLLQSSSTDAVIDVDVDPLSGKVLVTQTDAITIFDGLVVDSKPTVNSGASEKGKLWGDLRAEQNSANAYVTAPATDQRQVNEMVRGLASDLPAGVDLSKAKAWLFYDNSTNIIHSSYNIKSVTDVGTALFKCYFAIPFKTKHYSCASMVIGGGGNFVTGNDSLANHSRDKFYGYIDGGDGASAGDYPVMMVFFGELENE